MSKNLTVSMLISLGLLLVACGDDDDDGDRVDAGRDAAVADAGTMDAGAGDAGEGDAGAGDAGADAGAADAGGAFTSTLSLTTAEEVPVCAAAGASAMGTGTLTIDAEGTLDLTVTYSGLSGAVTMGHIHLGEPGVAGPAILPFDDLSSPIEESFTEADYPASPPAGAPADWESFLDAVRAGDTYVNLHTAACAPGEIRDQIE